MKKFILGISAVLLLTVFFVSVANADPDCSPGYWQGDGGYCECPAGYKEIVGMGIGCTPDDSQTSASICYADCQGTLVACIDSGTNPDVCSAESERCVTSCVTGTTTGTQDTSNQECPIGYHKDGNICCEQYYKAAANGLACIYSGEETPTATSTTPQQTQVTPTATEPAPLDASTSPSLDDSQQDDEYEDEDSETSAGTSQPPQKKIPTQENTKKKSKKNKDAADDSSNSGEKDKVDYPSIPQNAAAAVGSAIDAKAWLKELKELKDPDKVAEKIGALGNTGLFELARRGSNEPVDFTVSQAAELSGTVMDGIEAVAEAKNYEVGRELKSVQKTLGVANKVFTAADWYNFNTKVEKMHLSNNEEAAVKHIGTAITIASTLHVVPGYGTYLGTAKQTLETGIKLADSGVGSGLYAVQHGSPGQADAKLLDRAILPQKAGDASYTSALTDVKVITLEDGSKGFQIPQSGETYRITQKRTGFIFRSTTTSVEQLNKNGKWGAIYNQ